MIRTRRAALAQSVKRLCEKIMLKQRALLFGRRMVANPTRPIKPGGRMSGRSAAEVEGLPPFRRETERHRNRSKADGEGTGMQPCVGVGGVVDEPAGPRPQRHPEAGKGRARAEPRAHDFGAEDLADQHGIEWHPPAI